MKYDYVCLNCGAELEIEHSIKDDAKTTHPHPHAKPMAMGSSMCLGQVKRLIGAGATFILKGGGWASDGYAG